VSPDEPIDGDTIPAPAPANDAEHPALVIPAGQAQVALSAALDDLSRAFVLLEATSMALARQLDAQATEGR
jgi:hypothetical protein